MSGRVGEGARTADVVVAQVGVVGRELGRGGRHVSHASLSNNERGSAEEGLAPMRAERASRWHRPGASAGAEVRKSGGLTGSSHTLSPKCLLTRPLKGWKPDMAGALEHVVGGRGQPKAEEGLGVVAGRR